MTHWRWSKSTHLKQGPTCSKPRKWFSLLTWLQSSRSWLICFWMTNWIIFTNQRKSSRKHWLQRCVQQILRMRLLATRMWKSLLLRSSNMNVPRVLTTGKFSMPCLANLRSMGMQVTSSFLGCRLLIKALHSGISATVLITCMLKRTKWVRSLSFRLSTRHSKHLNLLAKWRNWLGCLGFQIK